MFEIKQWLRTWSLDFGVQVWQAFWKCTHRKQITRFGHKYQADSANQEQWQWLLIEKKIRLWDKVEIVVDFIIPRKRFSHVHSTRVEMY